MKRYIVQEAAHLADDIAPLVAQIAMGDEVMRALMDSRNPFSMMLEKACVQFQSAALSLLDPAVTDLTTPQGIEQARSLQATARRYIEMCEWISESMSDAHAAETTLSDDEEEEDAVAQLMEQQNGHRAQPAPDA